jgi:N-acetylglucosaminyl-diphospho-decaprenol L-rhamnosyltransferase
MNRTSSPSVGVVVITYNSAHCLERCLESLRPLDVVVVDNGSGDESLGVARAAGVSAVDLGRNYGYALACNRGAEQFDASVQWIGIVNPDVEIDAREIERMTREASNEIVALSPLNLDPSGTPQLDIARPLPHLGAVAARYLFSSRFDLPARRIYKRLLKADERYFFVDATSGGSLFVRADVFRAVGGFREDFFLNGEDLDLSERLRRFGSIAIDRSVLARHTKGRSSDNVPFEGRMLECARADVQYFGLRAPKPATLFVGAAVFVGSLMRGILLRARSRSGKPAGRLIPTYLRLAREIARIVRGRDVGRHALPGPLFL